MVESHSPAALSDEGRPVMGGGGRPAGPRGWEGSQLGRLVTMFHAPQRTFAVLAQSPTIAAVLVAAMLLPTLGTVVVIGTLDFEPALSESFERGSETRESWRPEPPPGSEREERLERASSIGRTIGMLVVLLMVAIAVPIGVAVTALVIALVCFVAFRVVGHESSYKSVLSVVLHSWWPSTVAGTVLLAVTHWLSRPVDPDEVETLVKTSLAAFLNDPSPALWAVAGQLDVLGAWTVVLTGIGFAIVLGISRRRSFTVVLTLWLAGTFLWVGVVVGANMISDRLGVPLPFP